MSLSMHDLSVPVYVRRLEALSAILDKAAAHAEARKIAPETLLQARLYPDMLPLARQVQIACGHAVRGCARICGQEPEALDDMSGSFADLKAGIAATIAIVTGKEASLFAGAEDRDVVFPVGDRKLTLKGVDYLIHFSMPNFYFHVTTAYAILRHNGLEIGKDDFMGDE